MIDGLLTAGEEKNVAFRTGKTSPQSFVIDLGREYKTAELDRFMIAYTNPRTLQRNILLSYQMMAQSIKRLHQEIH